MCVLIASAQQTVEHMAPAKKANANASKAGKDTPAGSLNARTTATVTVSASFQHQTILAGVFVMMASRVLIALLQHSWMSADHLPQPIHLNSHWLRALSPCKFTVLQPFFHGTRKLHQSCCSVAAIIVIEKCPL